MYKSTVKGTILLYNIKGSSYERQLKMLLIRLGFRMKAIEPAMYKQPLGYLAGLKEFSATETPVADADHFSEPMMVFHQITNANLDLLLKELRKAGIRIPLKAILTAHNIHWDSIALYHELCEEHAKFQELETDPSSN